MAEGGSCLRSEELRRRRGVGVERRNVNKPVDIVLGHSVGDALGSFNVDVFQSKVPDSLLSHDRTPQDLAEIEKAYFVG
jgi:hypothetical protein